MSDGDNGPTKRPLHHDFGRFMLVGGLGFAINFAILYLLYYLAYVPIFISQLIASEIALGNNFWLHHHWTYRGHNSPKTIKRLLVEFHASSWVSIVGSAILVTLGVKLFRLSYLVALIAASIVAAGWNFGWTRYYIWRHRDLEG